jgi:hypothetical protein
MLQAPRIMIEFRPFLASLVVATSPLSARTAVLAVRMALVATKTAAAMARTAAAAVAACLATQRRWRFGERVCEFFSEES